MNNNFDEELLKKINQGKVKMLPKAYFILKMIIIALAVLAAAALAVFFLSFGIFYLKTSGYNILPGFGVLGMRDLILYFPWFAVVLVLLCLLALFYFMAKGNFLYQRPTLYMVAGVVAVVAFAGVAMGSTSLHLRLMNSARQGRLSMLGSIYMKYGIMNSKDISIGEVSNLDNNGFNLVKEDGEQLVVIFDSETRFPYGFVNDGDQVVVLGQEQNGKIQAVVVRLINGNQDSPARGAMRSRRMLNQEN